MLSSLVGDNQLAVSAHPVFCDLIYKSLLSCDVSRCVSLGMLCEVICAVYVDSGVYNSLQCCWDTEISLCCCTVHMEYLIFCQLRTQALIDILSYCSPALFSVNISP